MMTVFGSQVVEDVQTVIIAATAVCERITYTLHVDAPV